MDFSLQTFLFICFLYLINTLCTLVHGDEPYQCHELSDIYGTSGDVYSPLYDSGRYPHNLNCNYRITAPDGYRLKLTFEDVEIYNAFDFCEDSSLSIFIFGKGRRETITKICGKEKPPPIITQPGQNVVHLSFQTDATGVGRGFHLHFEAAQSFEYCENGLTPCHNRKCFDASSQKCDGVDDCGDGTDEEQCNLPLPTTECGVPSIQPDTIYRDRDRIVGGQEVVPNSWPWQVSLQDKVYAGSAHSCGGTLINEQWVLTAAHCFRGMPKALYWRVNLGKHHKYFTDATEQIRYIERIIIWPDKTAETIQGVVDLNHDIGLVKLNAPVKFTDAVRPACLPQSGYELQSGTKCYVTGWGETRGSGSNDVLKQTHVSIMPREECGTYNEKSQICVRNKEQYSSTCEGDSGGPLNCNLGGKWYVMGATSLGTLSNFQQGICAVPEQRTLFMKVADKIDWIESMIERFS